jgi:hypothetical protein
LATPNSSKYFHRLGEKAMTPNNLKGGLRATGIHPYNPGAIPDEAYSPTDVLEPASNGPMPNVSAEGLDMSAQDDSNGYDDANSTLSTVGPITSCKYCLIHT